MDLAEGKNSNNNKHEIANTSLVAVPPMIVSELSSDRVSLEEGETATLICNVTGIPKPNVTWYKRNSRKMDGKRESKYTGALVCFSVRRIVRGALCQRCKYTTSVDIQKRAIKS